MHRATPPFWIAFADLPESVQRLARRNFALLKENPRYPSLKFKKAGDYWAVRIGPHYRALAIERGDDLVWVWIGEHDEYERRIRGRG